MKRLIALGLVGAFVLTACGTSDVDTGAGDDATTTVATAAATEATTMPTTEATTTTTEAVTTTTEAAPVDTTEDELAIEEAYGVAFNSESTFEETSPYLVTPRGSKRQ